MGLIKHNPLRSARSDQYLFTFNFDSNDTGAPDGYSPAYTTSDFTLARTGVGTYTLTFNAAKKPLAVHNARVDVLGDEPNLFAKVVSYVPSTGVLTFKLYTNAAGTIAAADTNNKTYQIFAICVRNAVTGVI